MADDRTTVVWLQVLSPTGWNMFKRLGMKWIWFTCQPCVSSDAQVDASRSFQPLQGPRCCHVQEEETTVASRHNCQNRGMPISQPHGSNPYHPIPDKSSVMGHKHSNHTHGGCSLFICQFKHLPQVTPKFQVLWITAIVHNPLRNSASAAFFDAQNMIPRILSQRNHGSHSPRPVGQTRANFLDIGLFICSMSQCFFPKIWNSKSDSSLQMGDFPNLFASFGDIWKYLEHPKLTMKRFGFDVHVSTGMLMSTTLCLGLGNYAFELPSINLFLFKPDFCVLFSSARCLLTANIDFDWRSTMWTCRGTAQVQTNFLFFQKGSKAIGLGI